MIVEDPRMCTPALSEETVAALVTATHAAHLKVIAHISTTTALRIAGDAGVDVVTHAPLNADVDGDIPASFAARGVVSVPTLILIKNVVANAAIHNPV